MKEHLDIEHLFRDNFEDYQVSPSAKVWHRLFLRLSVRRLSVGGLNGFVLLGGFLFLMIIGGVILRNALVDSTTSVAQTGGQSEQLEAAVVSDERLDRSVDSFKDQHSSGLGDSLGQYRSEDSLLLETRIAEEFDLETKDSLSDKPGGSDIFVSSVLQDSPIEDMDSRELVRHGLAVSRGSEGSVEDMVNGEDTFVAAFEASVLEGCAPLSVEFKNMSSVGDYHWDFGNGEVGSDVDGRVVYDKAGRYEVVLWVLDAMGGLEASYRQTIVVNASPEAIAGLSSGGSLSLDDSVRFYNNSYGGSYYEWDFGDDLTSDEVEASHLYKESGVYDVKLRVWTEHSCSDSLIIPQVIVEEGGYEVVFPTGFMPSISGSISGYYRKNDESNQVFYPSIARGVARYHLRIWNRSGFLMFETEDINQGWNGYYNGKLAAEDVYIYHATIVYENGMSEEVRGDVTLLYSNK